MKPQETITRIKPGARKVLERAKETRFDKIASIDAEIKRGEITKEEKVELKSYKIVRALKNQKYVRGNTKENVRDRDNRK